MFSEEAKREMLEAAASSSLRRDFEIMAENVRRADRRMTLDGYLAFLKAVQSAFNVPCAPRAHEHYARALI